MNVNERMERIARLDSDIDAAVFELEQHACEAVRLAACAHYSDDPIECLANLRDQANVLQAAAESQARNIKERSALVEEQRAWEREAAGR